MTAVPPPPLPADPPPPLGAHGLALLRPVAVSLVVYNAVTAASGVVSVVTWALLERIGPKLAERHREFRPMVEMMKQLPWLDALNWIGLVLGVVALAGSIYLMRARNYGLAVTGAIVTMLNPGGACCCAFGTALGIWALVVLLKPEVQEAFNRP